MAHSIRSMTGFGQAQAQSEALDLSVQIRSVNGRFLETRFRIPREYQPLEIELRKIIQEQITRGTVDVSIVRMTGDQGKQSSVSSNVGLAKAWVQAYKDLGEKLHLKSEVTLSMLTHVPGVLEVEQSQEIQDSEKQLLLKTTREALKSCRVEREREGKDLARVLSNLLDGLEEIVLEAQKSRLNLNEKLTEKYRKKLQELDSTIQVDPQRLAQEVLFAIEHSDVEEEIERALAHIKNYRKFLTKSEEVGKKLEFYTQELHREVNTMGSKIQDLGFSEKIIEAKALVERLREQVQNIE